MGAMVMVCPLQPAQISKIDVQYFGLDHQQHIGTLIVNKKVAIEVQQIFMHLDNARFPIAKIKPLINYPNEEAAMSDNDTFALTCRYIANSNIISNHSFGLAIDINPVFNPYVKGKIIVPENGLSYINRSNLMPGMIKNNDTVVQTFAHYGWRWGGNWKSLKDYQHFEKYSHSI
jgi:hypothetical protein